MRARPTEPKIGYLLNAFPELSETFILNELRAMEAHRVPVTVLSLRRPTHPAVHASLQELTCAVSYGPAKSAIGILKGVWAHVCVAMWHPRNYFRALRQEAARQWRSDSDCGTHRLKLNKRTRLFALGGWAAYLARRRGVEHLHAHYAKEPLEVAEVARRLSGISYSFAAHAKDLYTAPPERLARRLRRARFAVTCHTAGATYLRNLGGAQDAEKVLHVSHGFDTRLFRPRGWVRDPELILAVGRLTPKKGFDILIEALAALDARGTKFRCEIVGHGRMRRILQQNIDVYGLADRVIVRGSVPQEQLNKWYARASMLVMPSQVMSDGNRDGIPNVVMEAMACATPVVATPVGGIPEVVTHNVTGLLAAPQDPHALAAEIGKLLADPETARRLGRQAANQVAAQDFLLTNAPLANRFRMLCSSSIAATLTRVSDDAWRRGDLAEKVAERLGRQPRRFPQVEEAICRAVAPGVKANAWRPDIERLAARRLWDEFYKARQVSRVKSALNGAGDRGGRALDLGCGRGGLTVGLRAQGVNVVGLDLRFRNCRVTGLRAQRYGLSVPALVSHGETLPFPDGYFQAVSCLEVLEHVLDPVALLSEIRRVLSPEGACIVTVINRLAHLDPHYHLWGVNFLPRKAANTYIRLRKRSKESYRDCQTLDEMHYYTYRDFRRLARSLGFALEDPEIPDRLLSVTLHQFRRFVSLGFNSAMVVLRPV